MGVVLGSAVVPIALCISWKKANKWGSIGGSIAGFIAGIVAWLVTTSALNGKTINVTVRRSIVATSAYEADRSLRRLEVKFVIPREKAQPDDRPIHRRPRDVGWQFGLHRRRRHRDMRFFLFRTCEPQITETTA